MLPGVVAGAMLGAFASCSPTRSTCATSSATCRRAPSRRSPSAGSRGRRRDPGRRRRRARGCRRGTAHPPAAARRGMVVTAGVAIVVLSIMEPVFRGACSTELDLRAAGELLLPSGALTIQGALVIGAGRGRVVWLRRAPRSPVRDVVQRATARADRRCQAHPVRRRGALLLILPQVVGRFPQRRPRQRGALHPAGPGPEHRGRLRRPARPRLRRLLRDRRLHRSRCWPRRSSLPRRSSCTFWLAILPLVIVIAALFGDGARRARPQAARRLPGHRDARLRRDHPLVFLSDWLSRNSRTARRASSASPIRSAARPVDVPTAIPQQHLLPVPARLHRRRAIVAYRLRDSRIGRAWIGDARRRDRGQGHGHQHAAT